MLPWRVVGMLVLGGSLGTLARFAVASALARDGTFPWGVLLVNVAGSFALGVAMGRGLSDDARLLLAAGFLGAFTTMSAFAYDTVALANGGRPVLALLNAVANPLLSVAAAALGFVLARGLR